MLLIQERTKSLLWVSEITGKQVVSSHRQKSLEYHSREVRNHQKSMDVWLGEEVKQSFVHAIFKAVSHTLSCSLQRICCVNEAHRLRPALCAVRHPVREDYVDTSKHSTASCAPSPLCMFLPTYIRTTACIGRSDLNDVLFTRYKKLWQDRAWVITHVKGGRPNACLSTSTNARLYPGWVLVDIWYQTMETSQMLYDQC